MKEREAENGVGEQPTMDTRIADLEKRCAEAGADADEHLAARIEAEHRVEELERRVERLRDIVAKYTRWVPGLGIREAREIGFDVCEHNQIELTMRGFAETKEEDHR